MGSTSTVSAGGIIRVNRGQAGYPSLLDGIPSPPESLYIRGSLPPAPRVALVGSRAADDYGMSMARKLGCELAAAGVCVVSGGAGGIDTAVLSGCLDGGGLPVAVLGTGPDIAYPASNRELFERLAREGALVSEYPPGTEGRAFQFPRRNRIISGLSLGVVVVRAAEKSGSLITARLAVRQGRLVMAVPGPAGERLSAGVHGLLRNGARLVESAEDILSELSISKGGQRSLELVARPPDLTQGERKLIEALGPDGGSVDDLVTRIGMSSSEVASALLQMELKGLVEQRPGMVYKVARWLHAAAVGTQEGA